METKQNHPSYDVIISGAGPVGLFLACELALAKCSVVVLEKSAADASPLKQLPFGIRGLSFPTIESLRRRGLLDELQIHKHLKNPHTTKISQGPERQVGHFAGIPFLEGNVDASRWSNPFVASNETSLISEMQELETVFSQRAISLGVTIVRGAGVTEFTQSGDEVAVTTDQRSYHGRYLVGCDGSRSIVRKLGGFEFVGTEPEFTGYTAKLDLLDSDKLLPGRNLTSSGMYMQSQPGYIVMVEFDGGAGHRGDHPLTPARVQEVLRRVSETDVTITALHTATTWTDRARQATQYRNGRVLLAGDAAHIHSPLGGQGLNLGLGDAMNLGWKLAATLHQSAPARLLDSYQRERHPVGEQVLNWSRAQVAIMNPSPASRALNAIFRDLLNTRDGATYIASRVWGIFTRYDLGNHHPMSGKVVPDFKLGNEATIASMMRDGKGALIDFSDNQSVAALASHFSNRLNFITPSFTEMPEVRTLLVRPDGIVAWATNTSSDIQGLEEAIGRWFVKNDYRHS